MQKLIAELKGSLTSENITEFIYNDESNYMKAQIYLKLAIEFYSEGNINFSNILLEKCKNEIIESCNFEILEMSDRNFLSEIALTYFKYKFFIEGIISVDNEIMKIILTDKMKLIKFLFNEEQNENFINFLIEIVSEEFEYEFLEEYIIRNKENIAKENLKKIEVENPILFLFIGPEKKLDNFSRTNNFSKNVNKIMRISLKIDNLLTFEKILNQYDAIKNFLQEDEMEIIQSYHDLYFSNSTDNINFLYRHKMYTKLYSKFTEGDIIEPKILFETFFALNKIEKALEIYEENTIDITTIDLFKLYVMNGIHTTAFELVEKMTEYEKLQSMEFLFFNNKNDLLHNIIKSHLKTVNYTTVKYCLYVIYRGEYDINRKAKYFLEILHNMDLHYKIKNIWLFNMIYNLMSELNNIMLINFIEEIEKFEIINHDYILISIFSYRKILNQNCNINLKKIRHLYTLYTIHGKYSLEILLLFLEIFLILKEFSDCENIFGKIKKSKDSISKIMHIDKSITVSHLPLKIKIYLQCKKHDLIDDSTVHHLITSLLPFGTVALISCLSAIFSTEKINFNSESKYLLYKEIELLKKTKNYTYAEELEKLIQ